MCRNDSGILPCRLLAFTHRIISMGSVYWSVTDPISSVKWTQSSLRLHHYQAPLGTLLKVIARLRDSIYDGVELEIE